MKISRIISSIRFVTVLCVVGLGVVAITGSGGGGGGDSDGGSDASSYSAVSSSSFSPVVATDSGGDAAELFWKYEINGGEPLTVSLTGVELVLDFDPLTLVIDPVDMERRSEISGELTGSASDGTASGDYHVEVVEALASLDGVTQIDNTDMDMDMTVKMSGITLNLEASISVMYDSPYEWFLDRDNLDELSVGDTFNADGEIYGTAQGSLKMSGAYEYEDTISESVSSQESWEIMGILDSYTLRGVTYTDVVKVKRLAYAPNVGPTGYSSDEAEIVYWVAKGIGMIKGSGQFNIMGEPLEIELVETNLVLSSEVTGTE